MAVRATQAVIASLSLSGLAYTRASQVVVAAVRQGGAHLRVSQQITQALHEGHAHLHATQVAFGVLHEGHSHLYASQCVLEVLLWNYAAAFNYEDTMPAIFPVLPGLAFSVIKRPTFFNGLAQSASGREVRVAYAQYPLWEWDLTYDYLPDETTASSATASDLKQLMGFYLSQSGSLGGFLFKDPDDNTVTGQTIGTTDGVTVSYTLIRSYGESDGDGIEPVGYVDTTAPFEVYLNGVLQSASLYEVVTATPVNQALQFLTAPAAGQVLTVTYTYYYYVRFKEDTYEFEKFMDKLWSQRLLTLKSLRG